jgi:hypothetical protein
MILVVFILYSDGWLMGDDIHCFFDEDLRDRGNDCIAVTAQSSHSGGSPMSQRGCAGFNWPPLSIAAKEPVSISPEAVSRAGPSAVHDFGWSLWMRPQASVSVFRLKSVLPLSLYPFCAGVPAIGVG